MFFFSFLCHFICHACRATRAAKIYGDILLDAVMPENDTLLYATQVMLLTVARHHAAMA